MWSSRLFWKLFLAYGSLYIVLSFVFIKLEGARIEALTIERVRERLQDVSMVLASEIVTFSEEHSQDDLQSRFRQLGRQTNLRYTLIDLEGMVLADSERSPADMENHADRPEFQEARRKGLGESQRFSATLGFPMFYVARPVIEQGEMTALVRVSLNLSALNAEVNAARRFLWLIAICVGLVAAPVSYIVVGRIVRPLGEIAESARAIASGDYRHPVLFDSHDELGELGNAFRRMQDELAQRVDQLQLYADRLATVLEGMVEGVLAVDRDKRILLANDACKSLLGIKVQDVVGRPLLETARNLDLQEAVNGALETQGPCQREIMLPGSNRRVVHVLAKQLRGSSTPGVVVVLHDVTELRRLENMRRDFVANVSHELKTPLASIKAYAETLRLGAVNDAEHNMDFVQRIEEQSDRLHQLIVDLLHLSRVESGKEAFDFASVSIQEVCRLSVHQHAELAESRGLSLALDRSSEDTSIWADREGLATILDNLIDNAIKYTAPGGGITVRWYRDDRYAVLEVEDSGIGIAPEDQGRIFERFYRVDKARSRDLGGTGLGLAIVKHLSQAFGGEVSVSSELGVGSVFRVRLQLVSHPSPAGAA
jgi:two-component system phosphate regulon sensor histidine kinase PhoR